MTSSYPVVKRNVEGRYYVDESCIYCELCVETAPDIFAFDDIDGFAYIKKQPDTHQRHIVMAESIADCPTESIGDRLTRHKETMDDMGLGAGTTPKSMAGGIFQLVARLLSKE